MSNGEIKNKKRAENVDITENMLFMLSEARILKSRMFMRNFDLLCNNSGSTICDSDCHCNCTPDSECYSIDIPINENKSFNMLFKIFTLSVPFLLTKESAYLSLYNAKICSDNLFFKALTKQQFDSDDEVSLQIFPINYFDNLDRLNSLRNWHLKTPINNVAILKECSSHNIIDIFQNFHAEIQNKANEKAEELLHEELKPHYEIACDYIEGLLKNIIELNHRKDSKIDFNNYKLPEGDDLEDFFKTKAEKLIFDFEILYYFIRSFHGENSISALYSTLQNIVMSVTDFLNEFSDDLSKQF